MYHLSKIRWDPDHLNLRCTRTSRLSAWPKAILLLFLSWLCSELFNWGPQNEHPVKLKAFKSLWLEDGSIWAWAHTAKRGVGRFSKDSLGGQDLLASNAQQLSLWVWLRFWLLRFSDFFWLQLQLLRKPVELGIRLHMFALASFLSISVAFFKRRKNGRSWRSQERITELRGELELCQERHQTYRCAIDWGKTLEDSFFVWWMGGVFFCQKHLWKKHEGQEEKLQYFGKSDSVVVYEKSKINFDS